ncbi:MAG: hypothetical protein FWG12_00785 [Holophagaceae bacterium]|nr:hypothetical protein [Holophagaceae bacterium]
MPVRTGEARKVLLSGGYFFLLLASYYLLRPLRETFGISRGADQLPLIWSCTLGAMAVINPLYSSLVARWPRRVFIPGVYQCFALMLVGFGLLYHRLPGHGGAALGYTFYVWLSVFNLFVVSIFWAFMSDLYNNDDGKRLFGVIAIGGTLGAIAGASFTGRFSDWLGSGYSQWLFYASAFVLELAVLCVFALFRIGNASRTISAKSDEINICMNNTKLRLMGIKRETQRFLKTRAKPALSKTCGRRFRVAMIPSCNLLIATRHNTHCAGISSGYGEPSQSATAGLSLIGKSRLLQSISTYILLYAIAGTFLYVLQGRIVEQAFTDDAARTVAFARIDIWANVLTLAAQLFLAHRLVARIGIPVSMMILPFATLLGFGSLWLWPGFAAFAVFQVTRRGLHYAIDRPVREMLYIPLSPDAKYKAKSFIDTFVYRTGDFIGVWITPMLKAMSLSLGIPSLAISALWVGSAAWLSSHAKSNSSSNTSAM